MMTLPKLPENPSIDELRAENQRLIAQGQKMLKATGVLDILGNGTSAPIIGGSFTYGLMVYPDIDCDIIYKNIDKQKIAQIAASLIAADFVRKISVVDTVTFPPKLQGMPKGYWIGLEIPFEGDRWGIDCWFQKPEWVSEWQNPYEKQLKHINPAQSDAILQIKHWLIVSGLYGKQNYSSADVYDSVLDNNVIDLEQFKKLHSI